MRKLALGIFAIAALVACSKTKKTVILNDAATDSGAAICNVLTQTGCMAGERCTWIHDDMGVPPLGHIACAPNTGTVALGGLCKYGPPGATGYDNCMQGAAGAPTVCRLEDKGDTVGICKTVCDQNNGSGTPRCDTTHACGTVLGLFGPAGQPVAAGVCNSLCNPLIDNTYGSGKTSPGSACAADDAVDGITHGCYGGPDNLQAPQYSCSRALNNNLYHRAPCTGANTGGLAACGDGTNVFANGCAPGFIPLLFDMTGSMQVDCTSFCNPKACYSGNCDAAADATFGSLRGDPQGTPLRLCLDQATGSTNSRGTFQQAALSPSIANGDQCLFEWRFDVGSNGIPPGTTTGNSIGFCENHSLYKYDNTGGTNPQTTFPKCDTLTDPGFGSNLMNPGAALFGCVDTTTCGSDCAMLLQGKTPPSRIHIDLPHMLYHRTFK